MVDSLTGALPDPDRAVQEHITALLLELGQARFDVRALESLQRRLAAIRGRFNYLETATLDAYDVALQDSGMADAARVDLMTQLRAAQAAPVVGV